MIGVELVKDEKLKEPAIKVAKEVIVRCFKRSVVLIGAEESTVRIAPPLVITEELLMKAIDIIKEVVSC